MEGHLAWLAQLEEAFFAGTRDVRQAGASLVIATSRAAYCRLCWAAPELGSDLHGQPGWACGRSIVVP